MPVLNKPIEEKGFNPCQSALVISASMDEKMDSASKIPGKETKHHSSNMIKLVNCLPTVQHMDMSSMHSSLVISDLPAVPQMEICKLPIQETGPLPSMPNKVVRHSPAISSSKPIQEEGYNATKSMMVVPGPATTCRHPPYLSPSEAAAASNITTDDALSQLCP